MKAPLGARAFLLLAALNAAPALAQEPTSFKGRPLADVLQDLQAHGLRIIFSTAIVRPELRVATEPRAATPRKQLDEVLAPHGLGVREGPGQTLQVVRAARPKSERHETRGSLEGRAVDTQTAVPPEGVRVREYVSVVDSIPARTDRGASEASLATDDFARLPGSHADDPFRAADAFPGVTAVDDFRGDIAVRGSPFRQVGLVVDGVLAQWLRHISVGSDAAGSLTMLSGFVVERATLRSGAYPRRHGDRLGAELDLTLREGSRRELGFKGAVGGGHAVLVAEGPLGGKAGATDLARGSWLVSARQSYLEWPSERATSSSRTPFGFSDALAKVAFDVRPTQRIALTALRGISSTDEDEEGVVPAELADGINRASAVSLSWQSTIRPAFVVRQRIVWTAQRSSGYRTLARAYENEAFAYRADMSRPVARGMLDAGGLVERTRWKSDATFADSSSWVRSGFAHFSWPVTSSLTLSPGVRVTWSTLTPAPAVSRWLLGEWTFRRGWSLIGSAGASRQLPELWYYTGDTGTDALDPERASHVELGVEQRMTSGVRWQATIFSRREADVIRFPRLQPRLIGGDLIFPAPDEGYANTLGGTSRGVELLVSRSSASGLTGWASYAYGRMRQRDGVTAETFWADFDQRHAFKVFARYRPSPTTSVGMTFRAGSNFPIPGYFTQSDGRLLVGSAKNQVRLPPYARLDLRADRMFRYRGGSFTLFVEGLNVLNRANVGLVDGSIDTETLAAVGFTDTLLRRRASAGVVFAF